MEDISVNANGTPGSSMKRVFLIRLLFGLLQGVLLYSLIRLSDSLAKHHALFNPLLGVSWLLPPTLILGAADIRSRRLWFWSALLLVLIVILEHHATSVGTSTGVIWVCGAIAFVGYALMQAGASSGRWIASYDEYFECSWKLGLQCVLAGLFTLLLWGILLIGGGLFMALKMPLLMHLIRQPLFVFPVTAATLSIGLHLADAKPEMIRGIRTLALTTLSWLLPLLVALVLAFLVSIAFVGLQPLWDTRYAAILLLGTLCATVFLINTVFKSGQRAEAVPQVLKTTARLACVTLVPLLAIAAYAIGLRVAQYGWTPQRVRSAALAIIAAVYGIGYARAAFNRHGWIEQVAPSNIFCAYLSLAVLVALYTPLADPMRLSVDSQVERLLSGNTDAAKFDYVFLKFDSGRYGAEALSRLSVDTRGVAAAVIRQRSLATDKLHSRYETPAVPVTQIERSANLLAVLPGQQVPVSFVEHDWTKDKDTFQFPACLTNRDEKCDVYLLDLSHDGKPFLLAVPQGVDGGGGAVFAPDASGGWSFFGQVPYAMSCPKVREAMAADHYRLVPPALLDIEVGGSRFRLKPNRDDDSFDCDAGSNK